MVIKVFFMIRCLFSLWYFLCLSTALSAQQGKSFEQELSGIKNLICFHDVKLFYQLTKERWAWVDHQDRQHQLYDLLRSSPYLALKETDYQFPFLKTYWSQRLPLKSREDSLEADVRLTDAAIHFFCDLHSGNISPDLRFDGLKRSPDDESIVQLLCRAIQQGELVRMMQEVQPQSKAYVNALSLLRHFVQITSDTASREVVLTSSKPTWENKTLRIKLYQLGMMDSLNQPLSNLQLLEKVKKTQSLLGVLDDGVLRSTTLEVLNIPLWRRELELECCINYIRWLTPLQNQASLALVNLPSATLMIIEKEKTILESRLIVGKRSTPTPTLSSTITELVIYPYWMVPHKIATRELLPSIKKNIGFLDMGGFQVVSKSGKVLDPYSINWHALSASFFPYILRQSTGCDNSLGIVKFNFASPFAVYLHDTPSKSLFSLNRRYFSHGCVRVEKPIELARYLLGKNRVAIDTLTAKGCIDHQSPVYVPAEHTLPLVILYSTAWFDNEGMIRFYEDVYNKLPATAISSKSFASVAE
jgi:murein L,D-transpeptidase YcbB/YkuD